jgi:hypothetical protein
LVPLFSCLDLATAANQGRIVLTQFGDVTHIANARIALEPTLLLIVLYHDLAIGFNLLMCLGAIALIMGLWLKGDITVILSTNPCFLYHVICRIGKGLTPASSFQQNFLNGQ